MVFITNQEILHLGLVIDLCNIESLPVVQIYLHSDKSLSSFTKPDIRFYATPHYKVGNQKQEIMHAMCVTNINKCV